MYQDKQHVVVTILHNILQERGIYNGPVTGHDIQRIINRLPNKKSTGLDEVSIGLLKQCSKEVSQHLAENKGKKTRNAQGIN
ncbi:hypothetical protein QE152_g37067 [Popillia japonica]|uniref:Maturase n=1 Tax=Popillia japonica TaxID=7064 RepID=A0AAW1IB71_POPJA